jgi:hypothetical protein
MLAKDVQLCSYRGLFHFLVFVYKTPAVLLIHVDNMKILL